MTIEKIKVRGVKTDANAVQAYCQDMDASIPGARLLLKRLNQNRINILSLSSVLAESRFHSYFYFSHKDLAKVRELTDGLHETTPPVKIIEPVGALCLFPHEHSLKILGAILLALGQAAVFPLSISSSLSTLTVMVRADELDRTLEAALTRFVI